MTQDELKKQRIKALVEQYVEPVPMWRRLLLAIKRLILIMVVASTSLTHAFEAFSTLA